MESRPVKIFSEENTSRLQYIADLILGEILGLSWMIVTDRRKLGKFPVINYSGSDIKGSCKIIPSGLLFEKGVIRHDPEVTEWNRLPVFFSSGPDGDMPFDIFSASFYLVTRYEEYLDYEPDEYGRFKASGSVAFKNGFLDIPIVDLWSRELAKTLVRKYNSLTFRRNEFRSIVTIDVDEPFAYIGRSLIGNIGGFIHDIASKPRQAAHRFECLTGSEKDPYEVFDYISGCIETKKADSRYFLPVGNPSRFDKNPSWKNEEYRKLIRSIDSKTEIGLHPSFRAGTESPVLNMELKRLRSITGHEITKSRFHYLRYKIPDSYSVIYEAGICEDYSMGYHDEPGFRAGISRPFRFYNVREDKLSGLRIVPFQLMDIALTRNKLTSEASKEIITKLITATYSAGGVFVSIWHNTTLLNSPECLEWRNLFEFIIKGS
ncbi:MAG: hypothetical protein GYA41_07535 [Bacteroidales bacterium]|nr:hypothetical protein [Bacteroidales bacterium]